MSSGPDDDEPPSPRDAAPRLSHLEERGKLRRSGRFMPLVKPPTIAPPIAVAEGEAADYDEVVVESEAAEPVAESVPVEPAVETAPAVDTAPAEDLAGETPPVDDDAPRKRWWQRRRRRTSDPG